MRSISAFIVTLSLCVLTSLCNAEVSLSLSSDAITPSQTVRLTLSLTGQSAQVPQPDLSGVENDFEILNRSQSQSISIINGHTERETRLVYTLLPKRAGTLTIPAIKLGQAETSPRTIQVSNTAEPKKQDKALSAPTVFLEIDLSRKEVFVQSQLRYRVRLYYAENIMNGTLTDPSVSQANILRMPQDKNYQKKYKGRLYQVLERDYTIFPEKSGQLLIKGPTFSGLKSEQDSLMDQFDPFYSTNKVPVRLFGDNKTLTVKPIPSHIQPNEWLPATRVDISDDWELPKQMEVGQPIQRTIHLKVHGSTQAQLPELNHIKSDHFKVYADDAKTQNISEEDAIVAEKTQRFTYIPTKAGPFTIPDTVIRWWNIDSNQPETTTLSGKQFKISGDVSEAAPSIVAPQPTKATTVTQTQNSAVPLSIYALLHQHLLSGVFLALWLITMGLWWFQHRTLGRRASPKRTYKQLLKACAVGNPKLIEQHLIEWAQLQWPDAFIQNVSDVAAHIHDLNLKTEIKLLGEAIYGNNPSWTSDALKASLAKYKATSPKSASANELADLYP